MTVGTPAAETRDVNATGDGRIVQSRKDPMIQITITAFRGVPSLATWEIQPENGRTPSLAIAKISLEDAIMATEVFYKPLDKPEMDKKPRQVQGWRLRS